LPAVILKLLLARGLKGTFPNPFLLSHRPTIVGLRRRLPHSLDVVDLSQEATRGTMGKTRSANVLKGINPAVGVCSQTLEIRRKK